MGQVGVSGHAQLVGVVPVLVETVHAVGVTDVFGEGEVQGCKLEGEGVLRRLQLEPAEGVQRLCQR